MHQFRGRHSRTLREAEMADRLQRFNDRTAELQQGQYDMQYPYGPPGDEYELSEPVIGPPIERQGELNRRREMEPEDGESYWCKGRL